MKNHAQAILQFTGYPLEPIVALQINKTYLSHVQHTFSNATPQTAGMVPPSARRSKGHHA